MRSGKKNRSDTAKVCSGLLKKRFSTARSLTLGERSFGTKPILAQGVESEVDAATALTRARQARLPSPWTEAVDFLCFPQSHARQCSTFLLARAARSRKSTASGQGQGSGRGGKGTSSRFFGVLNTLLGNLCGSGVVVRKL